MCASVASQQLANIRPQHFVLLRRTEAAEAVWSGAVNVLADRWTRTRRRPETWPAVARGCKSHSVRISALAQGDQAPAFCSLHGAHCSVW